MGKSSSRAARNNRSNQMNPNNSSYHSSRASTKAAADNRSSQLNPNNEAYWKSREGSSKTENASVPDVVEIRVVADKPLPPYTGKCERCGSAVSVVAHQFFRCGKCGSTDVSWDP